jgi:hypothetical protein
LIIGGLVIVGGRLGEFKEFREFEEFKEFKEFEEFRSSGVQEFRSSGVQEFRSSGVQEFRSSGVQEFRVGAIENCKHRRSWNRESDSAQYRRKQAPELLQLLNSYLWFRATPLA